MGIVHTKNGRVEVTGKKSETTVTTTKPNGDISVEMNYVYTISPIGDDPKSQDGVNDVYKMFKPKDAPAHNGAAFTVTTEELRTRTATANDRSEPMLYAQNIEKVGDPERIR